MYRRIRSRHYHIFVLGVIPGSESVLITDVVHDDFEGAMEGFFSIAEGFAPDQLSSLDKENIARAFMHSIASEGEAIGIRYSGDGNPGLAVLLDVCYGCIQQSWN